MNSKFLGLLCLCSYQTVFISVPEFPHFSDSLPIPLPGNKQVAVWCLIAGRVLAMTCILIEVRGSKVFLSFKSTFHYFLTIDSFNLDMTNEIEMLIAPTVLIY